MGSGRPGRRQVACRGVRDRQGVARSASLSGLSLLREWQPIQGSEGCSRVALRILRMLVMR